MSDALKGGAPRGLTRGSIAPRGNVARKTVDVGIIGTSNAKADAWVFYVNPSVKAHAKFAHECAVHQTSVPEPVRDENGDTVTIRANAKGNGGAKRLGTEFPVAFVVAAPAAGIARLRELDIVESAHPYIRIQRVGNGTGGGELTERVTRILRNERREGGYRAGERDRGTIRDYADAPAAPAGATFRIPQLHELIQEHVSAAADGWRVVSAERDGDELVCTLRRGDSPQRIRVREPFARFAITPDMEAIRASEARRAEELARVSPPAEPLETVRGMGYDVNPVTGELREREPHGTGDVLSADGSHRFICRTGRWEPVEN